MINGYKISAIPAFKDNYIWIIYNQQEAVIVDPGEGEQVIKFFHEHMLNLVAILLTHHHNDHCGGVGVLQQHYPTVTIYNNFQLTMSDGGIITIPGFVPVEIITTPGHTVEHVVYLFDNKHFAHFQIKCTTS